MNREEMIRGALIIPSKKEGKANQLINWLKKQTINQHAL
jgi:hypothetical protein